MFARQTTANLKPAIIGWAIVPPADMSQSSRKIMRGNHALAIAVMDWFPLTCEI
jgi:hypothetical protein